MGTPAAEVLWQGLDRARTGGAKVVFDTNFRPRGWPQLETARLVYDSMLERTDILLSGIEDERALFAIDSAEAAIHRALGKGIGEVVVKHGGSGCSIFTESGIAVVPPEPVANVVDTTAAGDSFNAGYLAARLRGYDPASACRVGHQLAGRVIAYPGAIIGRADTQAIVF